ncbi:MAG: hypothetical protein IGS38_20730 [Synechococcales cyanobacterium M58_A2018_015]|nr:hypothetical protein [Synechococcales cyanobacterium M58_A2018_015]
MTMLPRKQSRMLLKLLNMLADFDGDLSTEAATLLEKLRHRRDPLPPLYADVFGLPATATCDELVSRIEALSADQRAMSSYAFQIFHCYEQMLQVQTPESPEQQAAYQSQLEQVRLRVAKTKRLLAETRRDEAG